MTFSARLLLSTGLLLAITLISKLIGFAREIILLENVGIGVELDVFLVLFMLSTLVIGALGICIVTSVTPLARAFPGRGGALRVMRGGAGVGMLAWIAATLVSLAYVAVDPARGPDGLLLALIVPGVVPFAIVAEYQAALFLSRNRRTPVIAGNIIVSLPLALALLAFDLSIIDYAIGLVLCFALRMTVFAVLLVRGPDAASELPEHPPQLFGRRLRHTLAGGSAMLAITLIYITVTMAARHFGDGAATMVGYGLKLPLLVLTSIWFVLGTGYFTSILDETASQIGVRVRRLTAINLALFLLAVGFVLVLRTGAPQLVGWEEDSEILRVFRESLPFTPLILLVPTIEMVQRLNVVQDHHFSVLLMSVPALVAGLGLQLAGLALESFALVLASPGAAALAGFAAALYLVWRLPEADRAAHLPS